MEDVFNILRQIGLINLSGKNCFENSKCKVYFKKDYYEVNTTEGSAFSPDISIYWLIGYLVYNNLVDIELVKKIIRD